jgi:hypothetical protein
MGGVVPFPDEILGEIRRMSREPLVVSNDPRLGWMDRFASVIAPAKSKN